MKKKFLSKNKLFKLFSLGLLASTPIILTSCSSQPSAEAIDDSFLTKNGLNFAQNFSFNDLAKQALKSEAGQNAFLNYLSGTLAYNWLNKVALNNKEYASLVNGKKEDVDQQWNDLVDEYKEKHGADWSLKLQQEVLDINGGSIDSWKQIQLNSWALTQLQNKLFYNNYVAVVKDANGEINAAPTKSDMITALSNSNKDNNYPRLGFSKNVPAIVDETTDPYYADFQSFIFDNYVELENPYVVTTTLWKYSAPTDGIDSIYKTASTTSSGGDSDTSTTAEGDDTTDDSTTTTSSASYEFPYFDENNRTNDSRSTVDKYKQFVTDAKTKVNFVADTVLGLKEFDYSTYSDETTSYKLIKNSNNFSDTNLNSGLAFASSYLYGTLGNGDAQQINALTDISKAIDVNTTNDKGLDLITKEFVSQNSIFANATNKQIHLSSNYVNELIKEDGSLSGLRNSDLYAIDGFIPSDASLNEYIFIRDVDGVRAISIDGNKYISLATSLENKSKSAGYILLYHYLLNKAGDSTFDVGLTNELTNFYTNNVSWLIVKYALENNDMFDLNSLSQEMNSSAKDMLTKLVKYISISSYANNPVSFANKMYDFKSSYAKYYGLDAAKNGLASPYIYNQLSKDDSNYYGVNQYVSFDNILTSKLYSITKTKASYDEDFAEYKNEYIETLDPYFETLVNYLTTLNSSFEGFKYSQYVLSNSVVLNQVMQSYANGEASSTLSTYVSNKLLTDYLDGTSGFNFKYYKFDGTDEKYINNGLTNYLFYSSFTSQTNRWNLYTTNNPDNGVATPFKITKTNLDSYIKTLWIDSFKNQELYESTTYTNLLSLIATVNYLTADNYKNFLEYMQNRITYGSDSYIVWNTSYTNVKNTYQDNNFVQSKMLDTTNGFIANINNNYVSAYIGNNSEANGVDQNSSNTVFVNDSDKYFNVVGNKLGFYGLQTSTNNSLPDATKDALFTKADDYVYQNDTKGVLYAYESKDKLISYINNISRVDSINSLITTLRTKLYSPNVDFGSLLSDNKTLKQKKEGLITIVQSLTDDYFSADQTKGKYLTTSTTNDDTTTAYQYMSEGNENNYYATYVVGVNQNSFNSYSTFISSFNNEETGKDVFFNLLIEAATNSNLQSKALQKIIYTNKIEVYDVRLNNQLGSKWVKNWKYISK